MRSLRRQLLPLLLLAAAAIAPASASAAEACPGANDRPSGGADLRAATVCLVNAERTARGLDPLTSNPQLSAAAMGWSARMVAEGFFAHETADSTLTDRVTATGYLPAQKWRVGENLAWGEMDKATPTEIVKDWMASDGHRANMLDPGFRDIGVGIVVGRPGAATGDSATYTADFGMITVKAATAKTTTTEDSSDDDVTSSYEDPAPKPEVKKVSAKKTKAASKKKKVRAVRARRALRRKLHMTVFAGHQRGAAEAAAALNR